MAATGKFPKMTHAATSAQGDVSPPVNPRASRSLGEQIQRRGGYEVFFPSSGTSPPGFFLYRPEESMAYRFHVSPLMAHTNSGQAVYVTGDPYLWSRLRASRLCGGCSSPLITALCLQVLSVVLDGTHGLGPSSLCDGRSLSPVTASSQQDM
jgi:hypothetical protein